MVIKITPQQAKRVNALLRKLCANYDGGNCLLLDDGEPCVCPQTISYSLQQIWHLLQLFQKRRAPSGRRAARRDNEADRRQALCAVPSGVCVEGEESALLSGLRRQAETAEGSRTAAPKAGIGVTLLRCGQP